MAGSMVFVLCNTFFFKLSYVSIYLLIHLSVYQFISLSGYLPLYLSISLSIYRSVYLSVYQSIYSYNYQSLSLNLSIYLYSATYLSPYLITQSELKTWFLRRKSIAQGSSRIVCQPYKQLFFYSKENFLVSLNSVGFIAVELWLWMWLLAVVDGAYCAG